LKKSREELQAALAAPKPDEAKIKDLVTALSAGQDKVFASFQSQRDEELALMTPVEQGKYLMEMWHWHQEIMRQHKGK
jgi:Spy/CpxP family protein refolding chaperone